MDTLFLRGQFYWTPATQPSLSSVQFRDFQIRIAPMFNDEQHRFEIHIEQDIVRQSDIPWSAEDANIHHLQHPMIISQPLTWVQQSFCQSNVATIDDILQMILSFLRVHEGDELQMSAKLYGKYQINHAHAPSFELIPPRWISDSHVLVSLLTHYMFVCFQTRHTFASSLDSAPEEEEIALSWHWENESLRQTYTMAWLS